MYKTINYLANVCFVSTRHLVEYKMCFYFYFFILNSSFLQMFELRQRKHTDVEYKKMPQQSQTSEWDLHKETLKWDALFKELGEAELILESNPTGFECYKKNMWPTNVQLYCKPKENGDGHIYRVYFVRTQEFEAWKIIFRKKLTSKDEFLFSVTKLLLW